MIRVMHEAKKGVLHASTWKMELMHEAEKYGLMHHFLDARAAGGLSGRQPPTKKDRRTVGPPNFPILLNPSGFPKYPA